MSTATPGWCPYPSREDPYREAYWDGGKWSQYRTVVPQIGSTITFWEPTVNHTTGPPRTHHVSGVTTGETIACVVLTLPTVGLSLVYLLLRSFLGRKRVS